MKKRILTLALALVMCLSLFPAAALAADSISVSVTKTSVKAEAAANSEGYGSLVINSGPDNGPQFALIDSSGNMVFDYGRFPCRIYSYNGIFANGIITDYYDYGSDGVYTLFDLTGKQVIADTYDFLTYYNGYAVAINRSDDFYENYEADRVDRFLIDSTGKRVMTLPLVFNLENGFGGGDYMFENQWWGIDYFGNVGGVSDGLMWFHTGVKINDNISEAHNLSPDSIPSEERYGLYDGGEFCGYMDLDGNVVIPQRYNTVYPFIEGLALVEGDLKTVIDTSYGYERELIKGKFGYIDKEGNTVIDFKYSKASSFLNGYAYAVNDEGKYGYIDKSGTVVVPMVYDSAFGAGDGLFSVGNIVGKTTNKWGYETDEYKHGFTDADGNIVVPLEYDDVSHFVNGVAYAVKDETLYILKVTDAAADVPSAWAAAEVNAAIEAELVPENLQKNYTSPVSRGNVAQMFINLIEQSSGQSIDEFLAAKGVSISDNAFSDTTDKAVLAANALEIINGVGDGKFDPYGTLTRAQIAAIINRTARVLDVNTEGYAHSFTDVAGHWSDVELGWPVHAKIINGVGDNKFDPNGALTTEQAIAISYRALQSLTT